MVGRRDGSSEPEREPSGVESQAVETSDGECASRELTRIQLSIGNTSEAASRKETAR
jgi:hypothetical protein